jgi:transketolase
LAYKYKTSHIGSCITAIDIINEIYKKKKDKDIFILSSGHAALAWYVILERFYNEDADKLYLKHGTHPNTDKHIFCSSGSLGHGLPIAIGAALADKKRDVYVLTSDGEWAEGSMLESMRLIQEARRGEHSNNTLGNLKVYINVNGYGAYKRIDPTIFEWSFGGIGFFIRRTNVNELSFLEGLDAHYHVMTDDDYRLAQEELL